MANANQSFCCKSGATCANLPEDRLGAELYQLYSHLTETEFYLSRGVGLELSVDEKDLAGFYSFDPSRMKLINRWPSDRRLGITADATELNIDKMCFNNQGIKIINESSMLDPVGFEFTINIQSPEPIEDVPFFNSQCVSSEESFRVNADNKTYVFLKFPISIENRNCAR